MKTGDIPIGNQIPWIGLGFCVKSLYFEWPHCLGCAGTKQLCCLSGSLLCCKPAREENTYCAFNRTAIDCVPIKTCLKCQHQCFICDCRIAIPCDDSVPCIFNILGATCYYKPNVSHPGQCMCYCCPTFNQLNEHVGYVPPPSNSSSYPVASQQVSKSTPSPVAAQPVVAIAYTTGR